MIDLQSLTAVAGRRRLALPALLFVSAHKPLAFAAGHLLLVAAPLAALLGLPQLLGWSQLLISPEGVDRLEAALAAEEQGQP